MQDMALMALNSTFPLCCRFIKLDHIGPWISDSKSLSPVYDFSPTFEKWIAELILVHRWSMDQAHPVR